MSITTATQATIAAIKARYDSSEGDAIRSEGSTGFYYGRAPESSVYPFIVVNVPASADEPTVGQGTSAGGIYNDISVDVSAFDNTRSPDRALSIVGAWHAAFNFVTLDLESPYKMIDGHRQTGPLTIEEPSQKGWHVVSTYGYNVAE